MKTFPSSLKEFHRFQHNEEKDSTFIINQSQVNEAKEIKIPEGQQFLK